MRKILKANNGKILSNGTAYGKIVYLASGDKEENWHEISEEEYERIKEEENEGTEKTD